MTLIMFDIWLLMELKKLSNKGSTVPSSSFLPKIPLGSLGMENSLSKVLEKVFSIILFNLGMALLICSKSLGRLSEINPGLELGISVLILEINTHGIFLISQVSSFNSLLHFYFYLLLSFYLIVFLYTRNSGRLAPFFLGFYFICKIFYSK